MGHTTLARILKPIDAATVAAKVEELTRRVPGRFTTKATEKKQSWACYNRLPNELPVWVDIECKLSGKPFRAVKAGTLDEWGDRVEPVPAGYVKIELSSPLGRLHDCGAVAYDLHAYIIQELDEWLRNQDNLLSWYDYNFPWSSRTGHMDGRYDLGAQAVAA